MEVFEDTILGAGKAKRRKRQKIATL